MLEDKKVDLIRAKEAVDEYLYGRGVSGELVEHPRYDSILTMLAQKLTVYGKKNYGIAVHEVLDKIIYVEADMSIMILEGEGPNGTAVTSKYYIDSQDGGKLKRLRLQAKNEKEVVCATISTYNDDGIEESLSTEQNLDNGDIYFSKATRDLKRPEVIKIERMKQVNDELTKMPDIYQFRMFMPALEDIYPDRDVVDPFDVMHFSFLGMPDIYRDLTKDEIGLINMNGGKITPLSDKYKKELLDEYKKLNAYYHRTKVYEKGLEKALEIKDRTKED